MWLHSTTRIPGLCVPYPTVQRHHSCILVRLEIVHGCIKICLGTFVFVMFFRSYFYPSCQAWIFFSIMPGEVTWFWDIAARHLYHDPSGIVWSRIPWMCTLWYAAWIFDIWNNSYVAALVFHISAYRCIKRRAAIFALAWLVLPTISGRYCSAQDTIARINRG